MQTASQGFTLVSVSKLTITTTSLPAAVEGQNYSQTLQASGGTAPYKWSLNPGGSLPVGLTLSDSGVISGTPTEAGSFSISVSVSDSGA